VEKTVAVLPGKRSASRTDRRTKKSVEVSKAPAAARAAAILQLLGTSETPLSLKEIAQELGLIPSTCLHVLRALAAEEFVACNPETKRYTLEVGVLALSRHWLKHNRFNELVQPVLDRIGQTFGVTAVGMNVRGLDSVVVVANSQSLANLQLSAPIGSRFPALMGAPGRCVAAFGGHSEAALRSSFRSLHWHKTPTFDEWKSQVQKARTQGFAIDAGSNLAGVTVVAAPVWKVRSHLDHVIAGVGLQTALNQSALLQLQDDVLVAARTLSRQLCGER
jgi:DNA-binding IclR family transcriptional regulator